MLFEQGQHGGQAALGDNFAAGGPKPFAHMNCLDRHRMQPSVQRMVKIKNPLLVPGAGRVGIRLTRKPERKPWDGQAQAKEYRLEKPVTRAV